MTSLLSIAIAFAVIVGAVGVLILACVAVGRALLPPADAERAAASRKVWREKRRELNQSVEARRIA
jgi:hypothetical protein